MRDTIFENIYLLPLIGAMFLAAYTCLLLAPKKKKKETKFQYDALNKPFSKTWANDLYLISFKDPVAKFLPTDDMDEKAVRTNQAIAQAGFSEMLDYRVLTTMQLLLLAIASILTALIGFLLVNSLETWCALFNLNPEEVSPMTVFAVIGCVLIFGALMPKLYINSKARNVRTEFIKNLPILQIFLVSMIKSNRPIHDILYTLGNAETVYRTIFSNAYRIYVRDKDSAYDYLQSAFSGTGWVNSIAVLRTSERFSRDETYKTLNSQIHDLEEEVSLMKSGKRNLKSLISEGSIALPFLAVMLLGIVPVVIWAFGMVSQATSTGL